MKAMVGILKSFLIFGVLSVSAQTIIYNGEEVNKKVDGMKEGKWVIQGSMVNLKDYKPDSVVEEGMYSKNRKVGIWKSYYANGNPKSEIEYKNGRPNGFFKTYYENGQVEEQGNWKNSVYTGDFKRYYPDGTIQQEKTFNESGKTDGKVVYYFPNGKPELEFTSKNGVESGLGTRYYANGDVREVISYGEGGTVAKREEHKMVNPDVKIGGAEKGNGITAQGYQNAAVGGKTAKEIKDGYHKLYNDNKDILMDGEFKNGKLFDGKHYIYDNNGLLEKINVYKNGKLTGTGVM
ncbi:MAG: toxin-antitoxin system YwqK family antitoxin [Flavobacteriales bacterium]